MDARKLGSFVVLAEELHFSRAAGRLGISQSTLSVRVRELERELGARLFERSTRNVALTEAGRRLLDEARTALAVLADTAVAVSDDSPRDHRLRIGSSTAARYGVTKHVLDRYEAGTNGAPPVYLREEASGGLLRALAQFRLDVCVTFCAPPPRDMRTEQLVRTRAMLTFLASEPAAQRSSVSIGDLAHLPLTLIADGDSEGFNAVAVAACHSAGIDPEIEWIPRGEATEAFRRAGGFTFVTRGARGFEPDDVVIVDVDGPAPVLYYDLVWRDDQTPGVSEFLESARHERAVRKWIEE